MFNDRRYCEFAALPATWEAGQISRFKPFLDQLVERAIGYHYKTKELLDSFSLRFDPFPGITKIKCSAEEVGISKCGGIITCLPEDRTLLGKSGLIMLEVTPDTSQRLQAKRALCVSMEEEFIATPVVIVTLDGKVGLEGTVLDPFANERKATAVHFRKDRFRAWYAAKMFSPFVLVEEGRKFYLFIGEDALKLGGNKKIAGEQNHMIKV